LEVLGGNAMSCKLTLAILVGLLLGTCAAAEQGKSVDQAGAGKTVPQFAQCTLKVSGMSSGHCARAVRQGLLKLEGVREAKADWKTGEAQVEYEGKKITPEQIVSAFNQGNRSYRAELPKSNTK